MMRFSEPSEFVPAQWLSNAHLQTIVPFFLPAEQSPTGTIRRSLLLDDGDEIVLHDDRPGNWQEGDRVALLVHGLGGSAESGYMVRLAKKLGDIGIRSFRMDMRGCGAGLHLAKGVFHAGRFADLLAATKFIATQCSKSEISLCGFSLGANLTLKMLASMGDEVPASVDSALVVGPPVDLASCCRHLQVGFSRHYDRFFARRLWRDFLQRRHQIPGAMKIKIDSRPRTLLDFDEIVTAPLAGHPNAAEYHRASSAGSDLRSINIPTVILASEDDPIVPFKIYEDVRLDNSVQIFSVAHGGHLGFLSGNALDPDRRWMDWRLVEWIREVDFAIHGRYESVAVT